MKEMTLTVEEADRLDKILYQALGGSRSAVSELIKSGHVLAGDAPLAKPGQKMKSGEVIRVTLPEAEETPPCPVDFDVPVIYEDEHLLIVNKPAGVVVHPAASHKGATLVDWLKEKGIRLSTLSGEERHGIVHRIDKETTGALVIAKTNEAHRNLSAQLSDRTMGRYYLAIIDLPLKEATVVDAPIARHPTQRIKMAVVPGGREARSAFVPLLTSENSRNSLIAAKLFTGRTHQIRVHLQHLGRHIVGDTVYGYKGKEPTIKGFFLHAYLLYLNHPASGETMHFAASLPSAFFDYLQHDFSKETLDEFLDPNALPSRFNTLH